MCYARPIKVCGVGVVAYKIVMRMRSRKICIFQCLVSRDGRFVENWKMFHFSCIDIAFCTNVI